MRQKELRIALVCYGGISLAVYMHGVTKELWKVLRASQANWSGEPPPSGVEGVYSRLIDTIRKDHGLRLRVLTDIVAGASAGGINSVFLSQAIHSGQSLEPLTDLWLGQADVDVLLDPDAKPGSRGAKFWAAPIVNYLLSRPGSDVSRTVAPETEAEVREKLSRLIRSRWFEPPFSGIGLSHLIGSALEAMASSAASAPLLPPDHPIDLFVTATDFTGRLQPLRLHSPPLVLEGEHRLTIGFRAETPGTSGGELAPPPELVFAARATASFPGAFPPLMIDEIDRMVAEAGSDWPTREAFLERIMPEHLRANDIDRVALIDGSVLVNAPFGDAISVLRDRPAHREVDRRFVYIDPVPSSPSERDGTQPARAPGFFTTIFGSLSSIPREQPIRDNLEALERQSEDVAMLRSVIDAVRPEVEEAVGKLFGRTFFLDRPTPKRLAAWRAKSQAAAWEQAGYAFHGYAQLKFAMIVDGLAGIVVDAAARRERPSVRIVAEVLHRHIAASGLDRMVALRGGAPGKAIEFFRAFDLDFRVRRLRLLARLVTGEREEDNETTESMRDDARDVIFRALAVYLDRQLTSRLGEDFAELAANVLADPGAVLARVSDARALADADTEVDAMLADLLAQLPTPFRRHLLLGYLGFPFYDTVTLPLLRGEAYNEFNRIKVDRISPDDCNAIRTGGAHSTLRGVEFHNFGAFFSRAYRENDYLWGRLHGAERMIDLICSLIEPEPMPDEAKAAFRHDAFMAILDEEADRLTSDPRLVADIRREIMGGDEARGGDLPPD
jgi:patatin-related protein